MKKRYVNWLDQQINKGKYIFQLGALIINDDRLVGAGYNRVYNLSSNTYTADCAEILALKKTPKGLRRNATIIVARKNKSGTYGMAKPCIKCHKALIKAGIRQVYFTTPNGWEKFTLKA